MDILQHRLLISTRQNSDTLLPKGYKRVSHIESVDGAYINLNLYHEDYPSFKGSYKAVNSIEVFGIMDTNSVSLCRLVSVGIDATNHHMRAIYGANSWHLVSTEINKWHTFEVGYGYAIIDGVRQSVNSAFNPNTSLSYVIFGLNQGGKIVTRSQAMGDFQAFMGLDKPTIARDLICCVREADGVVGMYDLCGSICPLTDSPFYINAGSGELLADGISTTRLPSEYQEVNYIEFTGTQYVDSNYTASASDKPLSVEIEFRITSTTTNGTLIGANAAGVFKPLIIGTDTSRNAWTFGHYGAQGSGISSSVRYGTLDTNWHTIKYVFNEGVYFDGVLIPETVTQAQMVSNPNCRLYIGAQNQLNTQTSKQAQMQLKRVKFGGTSGIERDFIPCYRKSDSVGGLYDLCGSICPLTGTPFYMNAGTGDFERGDDI